MELIGKTLEQAVEAIKSGSGSGEFFFCVFCQKAHNVGDSCPFCHAGWSGKVIIPPKNLRIVPAN